MKAEGLAALAHKLIPHARRIVENLDYEYELEALIAEYDDALTTPIATTVPGEENNG